MSSPLVYDKAKYHDESIEQLGLPEEHAENHTAFFLRWLIDNGLMSDFFLQESVEVLDCWRVGEATIHDVYRHWDSCLIEDMLSETGNAYAAEYFDFESGAYLADYAQLLQRDLPTEFHVVYDEANYQRLRVRLDSRYAQWIDKRA
jgi:hypothetical protein